MNSVSSVTKKLSLLFEAAGYKKYKMRKFEEYSLYLENKSFLTSEYVITFNDLSGKLLALKPDVTLSIVKNTKATQTGREKLYYRESVYRLDSRTHEYKEIDQFGMEILGDIDAAATLEVISLAKGTLAQTERAASLCISHMGFMSALLDFAAGDNFFLREKLTDCVKMKNTHDMQAVFAQFNVSGDRKEKFIAANCVSGNFEASLEALYKLEIPGSKASLDELNELYTNLKACSLEKGITLDLSIITDTDYYNGIVFQGFVEGIHKNILSGGRYDKLAGKFREGIGAMGFAVYISELAFLTSPTQYDCDVLLLYKESSSPSEVLSTAQKLREEGLSVRIEKTVPDGLRYKELREAE
ncbi:MAG: ATP phosphoribosyltransferase regulatory subunit [Clostridia bacterium]|nr:ATP phosphoribosyltransferase regulatory subunit [Clostridia bacterium]